MFVNYLLADSQRSIEMYDKYLKITYYDKEIVLKYSDTSIYQTNHNVVQWIVPKKGKGKLILILLGVIIGIKKFSRA